MNTSDQFFYAPADASMSSVNGLQDQLIPVFSHWLGSWKVTLQRRALSVPELRDRYDELATEWQSKVERFGFPENYEAVLRQLVGNNPPNIVLDCGVGTGALSRPWTTSSKSPSL